jgi:serine/threonine-protein kinase
MGVVYRGWLYCNPGGPYAGTPPAQVAVKVLHAGLAGRPTVRKLFLGEAEALRTLSHPNIVGSYGLAEGSAMSPPDTGAAPPASGTTSSGLGPDGPPAENAGALAIVLELIDGEPLSVVIERHVGRAKPGGLPCMPFARAWHYFQQLLGALAATHELGIVHRDVKPANLLIRRDGVAKLTDFGIARLPSDAHAGSNGMQAGTGAYMSPEQVLGTPLDGRSDLYSAAIVLYEMITGKTPFDSPDRSEIMVRAAQVEDQPTPITRLVPQAPAVIDVLFAKALAKDPATRFATAIELGNAFRAALSLPDTSGWKAQQVLASNAVGIVTPPGRKGRGGTLPIPAVQAEKMRAAVAGAYRK